MARCRRNSVYPPAGMHKPGEKAPAAGRFYCYICSLTGIEFTCEVKAGEMFLACPRCLERKVAEWDMTWKALAKPTPTTPSPWPGSLAKPA